MNKCFHFNRLAKKLTRVIRFIGCVRTIEGLIIKCQDCGDEQERVHEIKCERTIDGISI